MRIYTYSETCTQAGKVCNEEEVGRRGYAKQCSCVTADDDGLGFMANPECPKCNGTMFEIDTADLNVWEGTPEEITKRAKDQLENCVQIALQSGKSPAYCAYLYQEARAVLAELGED